MSIFEITIAVMTVVAIAVMTKTVYDSYMLT